MRARELPADLDDLRDGLSLRQDDLGKPHATKAIEVEREVLLHRAGSYRAGAGKRETGNGKRREKRRLQFVSRFPYRFPKGC